MRKSDRRNKVTRKDRMTSINSSSISFHPTTLQIFGVNEAKENPRARGSFHNWYSADMHQHNVKRSLGPRYHEKIDEILDTISSKPRPLRQQKSC